MAALQKMPVTINFAQGLDTKTDPKQIAITNFLQLTNSVFTTGGKLTKRNGYNRISQLPNKNQTTLTTFNSNLVATGSSLYSLNSGLNSWQNQGVCQPITLSAQTVVRNNKTQESLDAAVAPNSNLTCVVYSEGTNSYAQIIDSSTAQSVGARIGLGSGTVTCPKVFALNSGFVVTFLTSLPQLEYVVIPYNNVSNPTTPAALSAGIPSTSIGYDGVVLNNQIYFAWGATGSSISLRYMNSAFEISPVTTITTDTATLMSVCADSVNNIIYLAFYNSATQTAYATAFTTLFANSPVFNPVTIASSVTLAHITAAFSNSELTVVMENALTAPSGANNNYLETSFVSPSGTVTSGSVIKRSVGLAGKAFVGPASQVMLVTTYDSPNQSTYFIIDTSGLVYGKFAYSNGGGYISVQTLPTVSYSSGSYYVPYQYADLLTTVNKGTNNPTGTPINAIYTQYGVNLLVFQINTTAQYSSEIAGALHLTGGQLWEYDGSVVVEHGFHIWPEQLTVVGSAVAGGLVPSVTYFWSWTYEWTDAAGNIHRSAPSIPISYSPATPPAYFTADDSAGSNVLTSVSSTTGLQIGQPISGAGIPSGTYITAIGTTTVTMSQAATSTNFGGQVVPTAVSSVAITVPTLRVTNKTSTTNPVRLVGYRWSSAQEVYYQTTSVTSPILNNPTTDSYVYTDSAADAAILGNLVLYTTGGVVEDIGAPSFVHATLYNTRMMGIDSEDPNLIWYSKEVIEGTPVEFSDLFTLYIAPTIGAQGSTGPCTALSAMDDKFIIFKKDAIYYMTGKGPDNTGANSDFSDTIFITTAVGCSNPDSIVLTPNGLMFQSDKGIWLLGRDLSTTYIGAPVEKFNSTTVQSADLIPATTQVRFVLNDGQTTLMYDYFYSQWGTFNNINAISATLYNGLHTYLNSEGYVLQETAGSYQDDISEPVLLSFTTSWITFTNMFGIKSNFERFYYAFLLGSYKTPFTLNVGLAYDYKSSPSQYITVTPPNFSPNYGSGTNWGSNPTWGSNANGDGDVFEARLFPQHQKCESFQLSIQEIYDPSYGVPAGEGLSLSFMTAVIGIKNGYRSPIPRRSYG